MTSGPASAHSISDDELLAVESSFQQGLRDRSVAGLNVLGYGEIGLAIGWPFEEPRLVVKRLPSAPDPAESQILFDLIRRYEAAIAPHVHVTPTDHRTVVGDNGWTVPFLVQPLLARHTLTEVQLAESEPEVDHPMVVAVRDVALAAAADGRQALDGQFSNFAWDDGRLSFFDTGSPLLYEANGDPVVEIGSYSRVLPAALMPVVRRAIVKVAREMAGPEGALMHAAMSVVRIEQRRWLDAVLATFNQALDQPITADQIDAKLGRTHNDMKLIKRAARVQRAWATNVRRRPYDSFITDSFTYEIL
ncbi:MAG: DUF6206 family protein [Actinomycetota bacterium]